MLSSHARKWSLDPPVGFVVSTFFRMTIPNSSTLLVHTCRYHFPIDVLALVLVKRNATHPIPTCDSHRHHPTIPPRSSSRQHSFRSRQCSCQIISTVSDESCSWTYHFLFSSSHIMFRIPRSCKLKPSFNRALMYVSMSLRCSMCRTYIAAFLSAARTISRSLHVLLCIFSYDKGSPETFVIKMKTTNPLCIPCSPKQDGSQSPTTPSR